MQWTTLLTMIMINQSIYSFIIQYISRHFYHSHIITYHLGHIIATNEEKINLYKKWTQLLHTSQFKKQNKKREKIYSFVDELKETERHKGCNYIINHDELPTTKIIFMYTHFFFCTQNMKKSLKLIYNATLWHSLPIKRCSHVPLSALYTGPNKNRIPIWSSENGKK